MKSYERKEWFEWALAPSSSFSIGLGRKRLGLEDGVFLVSTSGTLAMEGL
jgi:hypothetical protein